MTDPTPDPIPPQPLDSQPVAATGGAPLERERIEVAVRYCTASLVPIDACRLFGEEVFPVCSPGLALRVGGAPFDLAALPLIESDWADPSWLTWQDWAARAGLGGVPVACDLRFNHYVDSIYAALDGRTSEQVLTEFAGQGFGAFKPKLADLAVEKLGPVGAEMRRLMADPAEIDRVLAAGAERAREAAAPTLAEVKKIVGYWGS